MKNSIEDVLARPGWVGTIGPGRSVWTHRGTGLSVTIVDRGHLWGWTVDVPGRGGFRDFLAVGTAPDSTEAKERGFLAAMDALEPPLASKHQGRADMFAAWPC